MKHTKVYAVVYAAIVLVIVFLSACSARDANGISQQRPIFSPAPGSPIAVACGASGVVAGDLNNDGKPDLIVACEQPRTLTVVLATSRDGFRASNPIALADPPGNIELGDVNGDSNLDLAIDSHDSYGVVLLLGDGKGGLAPAPNSPFVMKDGRTPHTHGLGLRDMNGDRKLDLITVNNADNDVSIAFGDGRGGVRILLGDGRGNFKPSPSSPFPTGRGVWRFAATDMNGDGKLDLVTSNQEGRSVSVLLGQ